MGTDITVWGERRGPNGRYVKVDVGDALAKRDDVVFAFLADICNDDNVEPIDLPRGLPLDVSSDVSAGFFRRLELGYLLHSVSWLSLAELIAFDYDAPPDRRDEAVCPDVEWDWESWRSYLGKAYFKDLKKLKKSKVDRIIFCFDD